MSELFSKNEINPTVKVVISMNQDEKNEFKKFADEMNLPFSALVRLALKNFIKKDGALYVEK
jgi:antitoxin component of RelBE/YafQ-DinJ toxin-antitoxin module